MKKEMKKAQSQIITTVLILLLVLVAIIIVWNVVNVVVEESSEQIDVQPILMNADLKYSLSDDNINIEVKRGSKGGEITGVKIKLEDNNGNTYFKDFTDTDDILNELETKKYDIPIDDSDIAWPEDDFTNLAKISVYFIYEKNREERVTNELDSEENPDVSTTPGDEIPSTETDCNDESDNDNDGLIDCEDIDCILDINCFGSELISYWKFENNADDEQEINNGVLAGDAGFIDDFDKGNVLSLDGDNDWVDFSSMTTNFNDKLTVSFWFKTSQWDAWDVIMKANDISNNPIFYTQINSANQIYSNVKNSAGINAAITCTSTINFDQWFHFVILYDGTNINVYQNGVECNLIPISQSGNLNNIETMRIGANTNGGNDFKGAVDEVMIYNRALTSDEITLLYNLQEPQV